MRTQATRLPARSADVAEAALGGAAKSCGIIGTRMRVSFPST